MPEDYLKESMTKLHGIRSGEPQRPESLIEMPSMVPEVPEVSLCFNQEKNLPLQLNRASTFEVAGSVEGHRQSHHQNEMLHRNKYESYNTWKAKNAQALHNITGGLERTDLGTNRASGTKRPAGLVRKQNGGNEMYSRPTIASKYADGAIELNSTHQNDCSAVYSPRINAQLKLPTSIQPGNTYPVEHNHTGPVHKHNFPQHRDSQRNKENLKTPSSPSNFQNHHICKERIVENIPYTYQSSDKSNHNGSPVFCDPNYCNKIQCSCEKINACLNCLNGKQFVNEKPMLTDEARANVQFLDTTKLYLPLESRLINNHLSSLSHIINIQKEQISMLCQEMNSQKVIMSELLEEVKKIYAAVAPNTQINRDTPPTVNKSCQCCSCERKNDTGNKTSEDSMNSQIVHNGNSSSQQLPLPPISVEKRSVGVMTSSLDKSVNSTASYSEKDKPQVVRDNVHKTKKQHQKPKSANSPSPHKTKLTNKKEHSRREEKRKQHSNLTQRRKNKKEESNESSRSEDSFSLDEAEVVVRTGAEQGDISPEVSIHVNMPDYSASSSAESVTSDSEDEGKESGTEDESSDPQIGWTFYDRVVGQVNNMLKKTTSDPRQEYGHTRRRNEGNVLYQCNEDYETENNWSKRVTFDGPPLEDSDNNGLHMPRYHHFTANQDYRMAGGPERVQDFVVRDYANGGNNLSLVNGSTNVSFATYRYYQRHQLLPPHPPPDQVFLDPPQIKKKTKTRKSEITPPKPQKSHKRRNGGPPSKILDMSALKHQPKLF